MADGGVSRFANRSMTWIAGVAFLLAWALLAGLGGPFGMTVSQPDVLARIAHFAIAAVVAATSTLLIEALLARFVRWPGWVMLGMAAVLAAIPTTFAVKASLDMLLPGGAARAGWLALGAETLVINLVLTFLARHLLGDRFLLRQPAPAVRASAPMAEFLPPEYRQARILAVQADDHYLRVHTERGATLIHMAIGQAESLLSAENGIRTHRSFWVARRAVTGVKRNAGRMQLELEGGIVAPVARARMAAVDAWLASA